MNTYAYFIKEEDSVDITNNIEITHANNEKDCLWKIYLMYFNNFSKIFFLPYPYLQDNRYKDYAIDINNVENLRVIINGFNSNNINLSILTSSELGVLKKYFFDMLEYSWSGYKKFIPDNPNPPSNNGVAFCHFVIYFKSM